MSARQMALALEYRPARGRADFLVSGSNRAAMEAIEGWAGWPGRRMALVGPARAGKSHLGAVWSALSGAATVEALALDPARVDALAGAPLVVEDVPALAELDDPAPAESALLHLHNALYERGHALLLTGRTAPGHWQAYLPDLASRLAALPTVRIEAPDERLLASVLLKLAADRQIVLPPAVVSYIVPRMERSLAAAERLVTALDRASLAARRPVTRPLAASILEALAEPPADR
ncbi:MAG: DnaA/Hda family protein [Pseudomonadota bacterium]